MRRYLGFLLLLALTGFSLGCSSAARWQFGRARAVEEHGNPQKALAMYESVLERMPPGERAWRSEVLFRMGECLWTMDRASEAFALFQKAADLNENHMLARLRLGEIYLAGGAIDRASEQAHAVLRMASANTEALALLGAASSVAGDNKLAEAAFQQVLEADPRRVNIAVALAELYNREDRLPEARAVLAKAAEAQPASAAPWLALGRLEEQEGNTAAAEQAYRKAVATEDGPESNLRLAQFLQRATRIDEAEQILQRVDLQRPKLPTALPDFEMAAGRTSRALDRYLIALRSFPMPQASPKNVWKPTANISNEVAKSSRAKARSDKNRSRVFW
jgi:tetratricopeptide (TPR) repeat protein